MSTILINLGAEHDETLLIALNKALKTLKAKRVGDGFGIGGSQEINNGVFALFGETITIESETYVGITVNGSERVLKFLCEAVDLFR